MDVKWQPIPAEACYAQTLSSRSYLHIGHD